MPPDKDVGVCDAHAAHCVEIQNLKDSDLRQWEVIDRLQNRLPAWATVVISVLTFFLGAAVTYAALAVRLAAA